MSKDLANIYEGWDYQPGPPIVRRIVGDDGRPKIQLRTDLGVFQMELTGRPDGKRPHGKDSLLDYYQSQLASHRKRHGTDKGFKLSLEDFAGLHQEAIQYYHRYVSLFQLEDFEGVRRDTERNLKLIDFVTQFVEQPELAMSLSQFRPYVLMMNARAGAHIALKRADHAAAIKAIEDSIRSIREFYETARHGEFNDPPPELKILQSMLDEIRATRPLSQRESLQKALEDAIGREDYERAASLRDQLKAIDPPSKTPVQ
jgi:hypothetical protein